MKFFCYIILILITFQSCKMDHSEKSNATTLTIDPTQAKAYTYSDLFTQVDYVPIDTPLIAFIRRIKQYKDTFYLIDDQNPNCIHQYDLTGHFRHSICHKGEAEGEYSNIRDFTIDPEGNFIILDRTRQKLMFYDKNGAFQKRMPINFYASAFQTLGSTFFAFYGGNESSHRLYIMDNTRDQFEIKNSYLVVNPITRTYLNFADISNFNAIDGKNLFIETFRDTIYEFNEKSIMPYRIFDFGQYGIPKEVFQKQFDNVMAFRGFIDPKGYACNAKCYFETSKAIVFLFEYQNKDMMVLVNKTTNELNIIKTLEDNVLAQGVVYDDFMPKFVPIGVTDSGNVIFALMQNSFQEGIEALKKDKQKWQKLVGENPNLEILSKKMVKENPVLLIATPK